jgi:hypothetical protein
MRGFISKDALSDEEKYNVNKGDHGCNKLISTLWIIIVLNEVQGGFDIALRSHICDPFYTNFFFFDVEKIVMRYPHRGTQINTATATAIALVS